jgi:hypothetical protein
VHEPGTAVAARAASFAERTAPVAERTVPPQVFAARALIAVFHELHDAMQLYRDLRPLPSEPSADIPF